MQEAIQLFKNGSGKFAGNLYSKLIEGRTGNLVFSPLSIQACVSLALLGASGETAEEIKRALQFDNVTKFPPISIQDCVSLALLGASGETADEIKRALQFNDLTTEQLQLVFEQITNDLKAETGISMGTLMAISQGHEVKSSFNETALKCFDSITKNLNFSDNVEAAKQINEWIAEKTADKIKNLIDPQSINGLTAMILVNAVYFKGTWVDQFNAASNFTNKFYLNENDSVNVEFMTQRCRYNYGLFPELKCSVVELPYENSNASFLIFLPNTKTGLTQVEESLTDVNITEIKEKLANRDIRLQLPKFKIEYKKQLNDSLRQLGISKAFTDQAEFDEILETSTGIKITEAVHKAFIEVNEKGTEAAAATELESEFLSKPKHINVNYPFLFILQSNGYNIFMGRCCNPNL